MHTNHYTPNNLNVEQKQSVFHENIILWFITEKQIEVTFNK